MANLKTKNIKNLEEWNDKELRKLRITLNNRISSLKTGGKPKELPESHPLKGKDLEGCQELLESVQKAERILKRG